MHFDTDCLFELKEGDIKAPGQMLRNRVTFHHRVVGLSMDGYLVPPSCEISSPEARAAAVIKEMLTTECVQQAMGWSDPNQPCRLLHFSLCAIDAGRTHC